MSETASESTMTLYVCGGRDNGIAAIHGCKKAADALREAGHDFEMRTVPGYRVLPWTRRGDARAEVERLSGQKNVPILELSGGEVITGSGSIASWAKEHPAG